MEPKNIIFKRTLKDYNKKYRHHKYLLKFTKQEVEEFDKKANTVGKHYVLKNNKWWFIDGTYYQVPKALHRYWFRNLNAGVQTCICLLGAGVIATAITVPLVLLNQDGINRTIDIQGGSLKDSKPIKEGDTLVFDLTCSDDNKEVTEITKITIGNVELTSDDYIFDKTNNKLIIKKSGLDKAGNNDNILIVLVIKQKESPLDTVDFCTCSWSDIAKRCNKLEDGKINEEQFVKLFTFNNKPAKDMSDFIGKERTIQLNHQKGDIKQTVRVIGTQHGKNESEPGKRDLIVEGGKVTTKVAALTFEFANLISDSDGCSLSYKWSDYYYYEKDDTVICVDPVNKDYTNSVIRYALTGEGNNDGRKEAMKTSVLAARKSGEIWDKENYNKTVLSMLPTSLSENIKIIQKPVGVLKSESSNLDYKETSFNDKLFILSAIELGYNTKHDGGFGSTYSYYKDCTEAIDSKRIKKQVNNTEESSVSVASKIVDVDYASGLEYERTTFNYAGFNDANGNNGGYYWLRSPSTNTSSYDFHCKNDGNLSEHYLINKFAFGIAPAFCI